MQAVEIQQENKVSDTLASFLFRVESHGGRILAQSRVHQQNRLPC